MTASEYASYTFCSTDSANVSAKDVSSTNFVPVAVRRIVILKDFPSMTCAPELLPTDANRLVMVRIPWSKNKIFV